MSTPLLSRVLAGCALALLGAGAAGQPWLVDDFRAVYEAHVGIARGETELELRSLGDGLYEVESCTQLKGFLSLFKRGRIHELTRFRYADGKIRALWFERSDDISSEDRNVRVDYDWDARVGRVDYQGETHYTPLEDGTSNTLLMQIALMQHIRSDQRRTRYYVLGHKGLLQFDVDYDDEQRIEALQAEYPALRYSHTRPGSGTQTTFWAMPDFGYLPARCEIIKNGKLRGKLKLTSFAAL